MELLQVNTKSRIRYATLHGRKHIVAPLTLIVPGVLNGSKGALFYPPQEVGRDPSIWNHVPLVVYHPTLNGQPVSAREPEILDQYGIGVVMRSRFNGTKLIAEGWFDIERANAVDRRIIENLEAGNPIELSTGLFTDNDVAPAGSNFNGKVYDFIARNYRPDHLAILPDQIGACSLADGCGVLVNAGKGKGGAKGGKWVTLKNGTHLLIGKGGKIIGGPKKLVSKLNKDKGDKKDSNDSKAKATSDGKKKQFSSKDEAAASIARLEAKGLSKEKSFQMMKSSGVLPTGVNSLDDLTDQLAKLAGKVTQKVVDQVTGNSDMTNMEMAIVLANARAYKRDNRGRFAGGGGGGGSGGSSKGGGTPKKSSGSFSGAAGMGASAKTSEEHSLAADAHFDEARAAKASGNESLANKHYRAADAHDKAAKDSDPTFRKKAQAYSMATGLEEDPSGQHEVSTNSSKENPMTLTQEDRQNLIDVIVGNCACQTDEVDALTSLSDKTLARMARNAMPPQFRKGKKKPKPGAPASGDTPTDPEEEDEAMADDKKAPATNSAAAQKPLTLDDWMKTAPPEIQSVVTNAIAIEKREKESIIEKLLVNVKSDDAKKRLTANYLNKSVDDLRDMLLLVPESKPTSTALFVGQAAPAVNASGVEIDRNDILPLPVTNWADAG